MKKFTKILLSVLFLGLLCGKAQSNVVFGNALHEFSVSLIAPLYYLILLAIFVLFAEGYFIKKFFFKKILYGFGLAFLINFFSSILGVFIVNFLNFLTRHICGLFFGYSTMKLGTYIVMIPGYVITVLAEWLLLLVWAKLFCKNKFEPKNLFKLSLIMNFCSYLVLLLGIFLVDIITHGQNFEASY
jgi:hypothetical protein